MKRAKRFMAFVLAMIMVLAMGMSAMAATVSVSVDSNALLNGHTFTAYQIFSGTQGTQSSDATALGNVQWGSDLSTEDLQNGLVSALKADDTLKTLFTADTYTAAEIAAIVGEWSDNSDQAKAFAKVAYTYAIKGTGTSISTETKELAEGYYLIVDTTTDVGTGGAYNAALLQVTGETIQIGVKTSVPKVEKKVEENVKYDQNDAIGTSETLKYGQHYNDVADYNIGDDVSFAFYSLVPDMTYYKEYKYVFHDTLSDGLTLKADTISVKIGDATLTKGSDYTVTTEGLTDDCTFEITITNLKSIVAATTGALVQVDYDATLNASAKIGDAVGNTNSVILEYSNKPNDTSSTGKTVEDEVIVFTYELDVTKVDGSNAKTLENATFKLYNSAGKYVTVDDDKKVTGWGGEEKGSTLTSDSNGAFKIIGLDDGTYYLKEISAPNGYNTLTNPIEVKINASTTNGHTWGTTGIDALTTLTVTVDTDTSDATAGTSNDGDAATGKVAVTVENNKGAVLPSTGGIGTTMFYVIGGALVLVAVVLLVTRRRMDAQER